MLYLKFLILNKIIKFKNYELFQLLNKIPYHYLLKFIECL